MALHFVYLYKIMCSWGFQALHKGLFSPNPILLIITSIRVDWDKNSGSQGDSSLHLLDEVKLYKGDGRSLPDKEELVQ